MRRDGCEGEARGGAGSAITLDCEHAGAVELQLIHGAPLPVNWDTQGDSPLREEYEGAEGETVVCKRLEDPMGTGTGKINLAHIVGKTKLQNSKNN